MLTRLILTFALPLTLLASPHLNAGDDAIATSAPLGKAISADIPEPLLRSFQLRAGQTVEISARVSKPSSLPVNGRVLVSWRLTQPQESGSAPHIADGDQPREKNAHGIYTSPTANWQKLLHALDADVYVNYRAPVTGTYQLSIAPLEKPTDLFEPSDRWREPGKAPAIRPAPRAVKWPEDSAVAVTASVRPLKLGDNAIAQRMHVELEPNDTPEQAQPITLSAVTDEFSLNVLGSSDDIEYYDNGAVGRSGDDWFRIDMPAGEARLVTACLSIPDLQVAARIRAYRIPAAELEKYAAIPTAGQLLPIEEFEDGKNENERAHQQTEQHRIAINRMLQPGGVYFFRVEANSPAYDLELRVVSPAPYQDPQRAIRQGLYDHLGQVDSWISNRPRGASVERRIRDSGNLLGTNCMSCHTQSGVWGPAIPFAQGYRPQNVQLWRHLINTCYQSLRPTNVLKDAANNTSLRPLDLGDGPAGTRVAGHAIASLERYSGVRQLQSMMARRTANFVLQSSDPGGINAAGPGANVGQGVVFNYAGEILFTAWQATGEAKYFHGLEDKARRMLKINLKYCDDLGHRVEFFHRYFPADYVEQVKTVSAAEKLDDQKTGSAVAAAEKLQADIDSQVAADLQRLRGIQLEDGGWSFDPGRPGKDGKGWELSDKKADPSPTSLALLAFHAAGIGKDDPTVARGLERLLSLQHPTGYWKVQSQTGFVSTSYALHALSRYFPAEPPQFKDGQFAGTDGESLLATLRRLRDASVSEDPRFVPLFVEGAAHDSALVRYWSMIGLGATHTEAGVDALVSGLADRSKMVREAAHWGMRQTLIDDHGWDEVLAAASSDDDFQREAALRALVMRIDSVMPATELDYTRLTDVFARSLNEDSHPAVRAWAARASWQWWVWNPPVRQALNTAWMRLLSRPESNALTENTIRYQSHALLIANGHVANGSKEHQYSELGELVLGLQQRLLDTKSDDSATHSRLVNRLTAIASTFYNQRGGDGGPGQMGYVTPGSPTLFATAILSRIEQIEDMAAGEQRETLLQSTLEGAANIPDEELQAKLVEYSINGPEHFRALASSSISDPRLVSLIAVPEQMEPMYAQILRGSLVPDRRPELSDPIIKMYGGVRWIIPKSDEQRHEILQYILPDTQPYLSKSQLEAIGDETARQTASRNAEAAWYVANGLGAAVAKNPDLHFDHLAQNFPETFRNAAEARFWLPSVPWILEYKTKLPEVSVDPKKLPPVDPYEELRTRALQQFLTQLTQKADPRNRNQATTLANQTALRRNPEVLTALDMLLEFEEDKKVVENVRKVLSQRQESFQKELIAAVKKTEGYKFPTGPNGDPQLPEEFVNNVHFFRDYVLPEMTRVLRGDERSCLICHGQPGRVPSMELHAPDQVGFLAVDKLLANYRVLQHRINTSDVDTSKLLRKPLNVQSGKEDGHQGGRRYQPNDPGYQILLRWAESQVAIQEKYGLPPKSTK